MRKNKHSSRSLTAFLVTWAFVVLTVTGLILYVVPQGRIANWIHWSLFGMSKDQWGWVHMMFGGVFIVTGFLHLYYNWKPFKQYFADRVKGHFEPKQEVFIATALTVVIFVISALNIPPASWIIDLNGAIKDSWVSSPELEPPYGHAEEGTLGGLARKLQLDIGRITKRLDEANINYSGKDDTLDSIARNNGTTPMAVYELIKDFRLKRDDLNIEHLSAEDIEARFSGVGIGRKLLSELCSEVGIPVETGLGKLRAAGIEASEDSKTKSIADEHDLTPIDLLKIMLL